MTFIDAFVHDPSVLRLFVLKDSIAATAFQFRPLQPTLSVHSVCLYLKNQNVHRPKAMPPPLTLLSAQAQNHALQRTKSRVDACLEFHASWRGFSPLIFSFGTTTRVL